MRGIEIVFVDVETTGFSKEAEIVQIAACHGNSLFNVYMTPSRPFHRKASQITGMHLFNGNLYLHGKQVHTVPARTAFKNFMNYLRRINKDIILVAHNCFGFDMPRLLRLADEVGFLNDCKNLIQGFSDSLIILKFILKDQRSGRGRFSMKSLIKDYLPNESINNLHNAQYDVQMLEFLLFNSELDVSVELIVQFHKTIDQYFQQQEIKMLVAEAKESLQCFKNILSFWVINKMARARIHANLLMETLFTSGFEGLKKLFSENFYGRPRVTRNLKIIKNVYDSLCGNV